MPRLPSSQRVVIDVIEWYAYSVFLDDSNEMDILHATEQFNTLCRIAFPEELQRSGRLWNRLLLVNLVHNTCTRKTIADEAEALIHLGPQDWETMLQNLEECRSSLIKTNGNTFPPEGHDRADADYIDLPMFNEVYDEVHDLLRCHVVIAKFRQSLKTCCSTDDIHTIIDDYQQSLPRSFQDTDLVSALRKDVLSSPKRKTNVVEKILQGVLEELQTTGKSYSYDQVQWKIKKLAQTWNESILGIPTMVTLGYGGLTPDTKDREDAKTVSSWGMDEKEAANKKKLEDAAAAQKEESEDYHTAADDEMDDDDSLDGYNIKKSFKKKPTKQLLKDGQHQQQQHQHQHQQQREVQPLEIRPRESWKEDFAMIDMQKIRDEDAAAAVIYDDDDDDDEQKKEHDDTDSSKRNLIVGTKCIWSDSDDTDPGDNPNACHDDAQLHAPLDDIFRKTNTQRRTLERRKRQDRQRGQDEQHKRFLETDDDDDDDEITGRHPCFETTRKRRRPLIVTKRSLDEDELDSDDDDANVVLYQEERRRHRSLRRRRRHRSSVVLIKARKRATIWNDDSSSSEDENLPPFLKAFQISPKLPTYAEYARKKRALSNHYHSKRRRLTTKQVIVWSDGNDDDDDDTIGMRKKRRLFVMDKKTPRAEILHV